MAYRETDKIRSRKAATRERVLQCALALVARSGFSAVQMSQLASEAKLATGTLYRYFPSKEELFAEVFERATTVEVARVSQALEQANLPAPQRIEDALRVFARRALRSPRLAWALIAEPVDARVDEKRLEYRLQYATLFANAIEQGIGEKSIPHQRSMLSSTAMVGAIAEALIGPLTTVANDSMVPASQQQLIDDIIRFCMQGVLCSKEALRGATL